MAWSGQLLIRIVRLARPGQFEGSVGVQQSAWGLDGSLGTVPVHVMIAAVRHGGLVLGAFDGRRMVGILFGFTALLDDRPYHYSHIAGVEREYQSRGVGYRLKLAQRRIVIGRGMALVKWTFDPLQAGNAYLNLGKLGGLCRTYLRNFYGRLGGSLNRGRLTDRFELEWWVKSRRVVRRLEGRGRRPSAGDALKENVPIINPTRIMGTGLRRPSMVQLGLKASRLLVEIPENIMEVAKASPEASREWTLSYRRVFEHYFPRGYAATDVLLKKEEDGRRIFYLLDSNLPPQLVPGCED